VIHFSVIQLVASADCAGALDITDDLQHLLVCSQLMESFYLLLFSRFKFKFSFFILMFLGLSKFFVREL
jgi:hypothetical protein